MLVKDIQIGDLIEREFDQKDLYLVVEIRPYRSSSSKQTLMVDCLEVKTNTISTFRWIVDHDLLWLTLVSR